MPGDPKECRKRALQCADLAHEASSGTQADIYRAIPELAKLAIELECAQTPMAE